MHPSVSIIVPCYNEQATIRSLLDAILAQNYTHSKMNVIIADGLSHDNTLAVIADFQREHPDLSVFVIPNARRTIPSSLNLAIKSAQGEIIVRLDAHSMPIPEYVARCVQTLEEGKGSCVGGLWTIQPGGDGWIARSIAAAAAHPLGVGDAMYRLEAKPGAVDTVPFGAFRRTLIDKIGGFDETLLTNEDYEFNTRVRRSGGVVWLNPQIRSTYVARASLAELAKQYWRYGYWKFRMLSRYPSTIRWRQALPPLFVLSLICLSLFSIFVSGLSILLFSEIIFYLLVLVTAGVIVAVRQRRPLIAPGLLIAIMTMHLTWGGGFLWSLVSSPFKKND
jgi:glycosyltransferase involved in cell wall biosynthesis